MKGGRYGQSFQARGIVVDNVEFRCGLTENGRVHTGNRRAASRLERIRDARCSVMMRHKLYSVLDCSIRQITISCGKNNYVKWKVS